METQLPTSIFSRRLLGRRFSLILGLAALNLAIGAVVSLIKLPIYLDSIGVVIAAIVLGVIPAIVCGAITCGVGFFLVNPYLPAYFGTSIVIALLAVLCRRLNLFRSLPLAMVSGLIIAIGAALASAPITAYLFGGATLSGVDAITAFFVSSGKALIESVLYAGLASEPVDKVLVCLIAFSVLRSLPNSFFSKNGLRSYRNDASSDKTF